MLQFLSWQKFSPLHLGSFHSIQCSPTFWSLCGGTTLIHIAYFFLPYGTFSSSSVYAAYCRESHAQPCSPSRFCGPACPMPFSSPTSNSSTGHNSPPPKSLCLWLYQNLGAQPSEIKFPLQPGHSVSPAILPLPQACCHSPVRLTSKKGFSWPPALRHSGSQGLFPLTQLQPVPSLVAFQEALQWRIPGVAGMPFFLDPYSSAFVLIFWHSFFL